MTGALVLGALAGAVSIVAYGVSGFSYWMLLAWFVGLVGLSVYFWSTSRALPRIRLADVAASAGLVVAFAPIYLVSLYRNPIQVS